MLWVRDKIVQHHDQSDNFNNTARLIARIAREESILRQPDKQAELYFDEGL